MTKPHNINNGNVSGLFLVIDSLFSHAVLKPNDYSSWLHQWFGGFGI
jgi:hypothetical protein